MSNALAIAGVSALLTDLIQNGVANQDFGDVMVTAIPPDLIKPSEAEGNRLNLFLYLAMPNQGWRNVGLPSRNGQGNTVGAPPLALNLHYLVTAYGSTDFHAEMLLGYAMQILHETPVLTRRRIGDTLKARSPLNGDTGLPQRLKLLAMTGLAEQVEQLKICPESLSTEEMSRLWTALQAHYRPSAAYQVSVVLIESDRNVPKPLPVRLRNLYAFPIRRPVIDSVTGGESDKPIDAASTLVVRGRNLHGDDLQVLIDEQEVTPSKSSDDRMEIEIAEVADAIHPGIHGVKVVQRILFGTSSVPLAGAESNVVPFVLRPTMSDVMFTRVEIPVVPIPVPVAIQLAVKPKVGPDQKVRLLLIAEPPPDATDAAKAALRAFALTAEPRSADAETLVFDAKAVDLGTYILRLQVDGAESLPMFDETEGSPTKGQWVELKVTVT